MGHGLSDVDGVGANLEDAWSERDTGSPDEDERSIRDVPARHPVNIAASSLYISGRSGLARVSSMSRTLLASVSESGNSPSSRSPIVVLAMLYGITIRKASSMGMSPRVIRSSRRSGLTSGWALELRPGRRHHRLRGSRLG